MRETGWSLSAAGVKCLREVDPSGRESVLLLCGVIRNDNTAYNGEAFLISGTESELFRGIGPPRNMFICLRTGNKKVIPWEVVPLCGIDPVTT